MTRDQAFLVGIAKSALGIDRAAGRPDPRDPHPTRTGIFRDHNCWACKDGAQPCREGSSNLCSYPHARND